VASIDPALIAAVALAFDAIFGEPPRGAHPVAWMGRYLNWGRRLVYPAGSLGAGIVLLAAGAVLVAAWAVTLERFGGRLPDPLNLALQALVLKSLFSLRALLGAAESVRLALVGADLERARQLLGRHLVSRETNDLSAAEVAGGTIESLAENLSDSVVAPLFYYLLFGLAGAALYRLVNTADAVLGYRTAELERFGKPAARLDDALGYLPARLSALLLLVALALSGGSVGAASRALFRDAGATASPNAGWPMASVAGGLGVRLDKRGCYVLNGAGRPAAATDIRRSQVAVGVASLLALILLALVGNA
jgi:adenosylcobinamide-phosphate synthase